MRDGELHVMVDIETLGTRPDAAILQVGAVKFDRNVIYTDDAFNLYVKRDPRASIDTQTVLWWLEQSEEARRTLSEGMQDAVHDVEFIDQFRKWVDWTTVDGVWAHGASFDPPIIHSAYANYGMPPPWHYRAVRDTRTLFDLTEDMVQAQVTVDGVEHDALSDARNQARWVQEAWRAWERARS